jgi:hypothetical protein
MAALLWAGKPDLFVHGPGSSGKSSLIQAGIIPDILCRFLAAKLLEEPASTDGQG